MMSSLALFRNPLLILLSSFLVLAAAAQGASRNVSVGDFLTANDQNLTWQSPSDDFEIGFRHTPDQQDRFLLAIWFANVPEKTIVWSANGDNPVEKESKVNLTSSGLVLSDPSGRELWRTKSNQDGTGGVSHAAMLDTGNFVITSTNSDNIWESFQNPTDTILPGQELGINSTLSSAFSARSYKKGRFQLRFTSESLGLNRIDVYTGRSFQFYFNIADGSGLIFNKSGHIQIKKSNGSVVHIAPENTVPIQNFYYRATLDFDGVFTLYSHSGNGDEGWSSLWYIPGDICYSFTGPNPGLGIGPCGFNSICQQDPDGMVNCQCPPGFSFLDAVNKHLGCKPNNQSYLGDCNEEGFTIGEDSFEFNSMPFVDWPYGDYELLQPVNETECRRSCLLDCNCAVASLEDPSLNNGIGNCWKKKLPLSNGWYNKSRNDRIVLIKVPKLGESPLRPPNLNPGKKKQNQVVLILSVLLGTSAFFNIFTLIVVSLLLFCFYQRKLQDLKRINRKGEIETNLRSFTYEELEDATKGFKEELGKGSFGTVYKGELSRNYVAVKKLDKVVQEGEKEFKTEVNVIGQTHHRNLVRLLGYCDEAEHRLLVYELMQNGSLASFLFGVLRPSWQQRLQIASGIARGLTYLHEECSTQIIHCDIKPQNILLDDSFTAKISDFGLAKLLINSKSHTLTVIRGTKGYVAPEWFRSTPVTVKVDVYSFGVMLLEIVCCRRCVELEMEEAAILIEWAYDYYNEGNLGKLVENDEEARSDMGRVEMLVKVAMWCLQDEPSQRPKMRTVTMMLEGALLVPAPPCPFLYSCKPQDSSNINPEFP
ncbi:hypothetical protein SLEP1_g50054 [Rubroshorea leprosula]|uniref:Receptor-like serine/threonine-protein kinase n=1 Tax=Rubroshorea leprosula TaxID=152421 RepID=A0AAV5LZ21_9ROSI|nr:hypothetical protein SLEP1_g50054 [Rubroshorea leprosula]